MQSWVKSSSRVAIQADVDDVLAQLIPLVEAQPRAEWHQLVADLQREFPCPIPKACDPLSHYGLINAVAACVDDNAIITTDVGQHQMWTAQAYPLNRPRQWLTSGGLGTMGFGLPAAIGAALANPDRKVLCFSGDGSLMMNIQEMATASENQLDVKIILMNNEALGLVHQQQSLFYEQGVFAATYPGKINFMQIAAGFGLETCDLNNEADPQGFIAGNHQSPGPALIHVRIDAEEKVYPMVPPGAANTEMVGNKPCKNTTHDNVILELTVRNHPGVMTHVCGLLPAALLTLKAFFVCRFRTATKAISGYWSMTTSVWSR